MSVECSMPVQIQPGQYLLAYAPVLQEILPTALFAQRRENQRLIIAPSIPPLWQPGFELKIRGPLGCGFTLPLNIQHLALADFGSRTGQRLLPLADTILARGGEVVLLSDVPPEHLSAEIELLTLKSLPDVFTWSDYLAVDLPLSQLSGFQQSLRPLVQDHPAKPVEVLLDTPLVCGGSGSCGLCSVYSAHKWIYACKEGPVFPLDTLQESE